jgi:RNA polymerase sigma-70 factor (ECF subfamily)
MKDEFNEKKIIGKLKRGNKKAFEPLVRFYMKRAYNIALGFINNEQDALDISQEAFIKAYKNIKNFDESRRFFPWFYQIIKRLCFDYYNKRKKRKIFSNNFSTIIYNDNGNSGFKDELADAVSKLNPEQREIIILRYVEGCSYEDIALILKKPVGTIMSSIFYIKKKLKKELEGKL